MFIKTADIYLLLSFWCAWLSRYSTIWLVIIFVLIELKDCGFFRKVLMFCLVLPLLIRFSTINFSRSMSKKSTKRGWNDDDIQYGFDAPKGQCVICYKVLRNDLLRPSKFSNHLLKIHPEYKDKGIAFFERKRDTQKRTKLNSSGTYYKENISLVEASYKVALTIAKQKKSHTIAETLVKRVL